jgi:hypothetical protein
MALAIGLAVALLPAWPSGYGWCWDRRWMLTWPFLFHRRRYLVAASEISTSASK